MRLAELIDQLAAIKANGVGGDSLVAVAGDGIPPHTIIETSAERHDDGDWTTTIWLRVEEM